MAGQTTIGRQDDDVIPLYGFLEGDTLGLLVFARPTDTILELGQKLQEAAKVRVAPSLQLRVSYRGCVLDPALTVTVAGIEPLDRFDVAPDKAP